MRVLTFVAGLLIACGSACSADSNPPSAADRTVPVGGGDAIVLKWIPPGAALLGSTPAERAWAIGSEGRGEAGWYLDESVEPQPFRLSDGYWLGATEVTIGQWRQFVSQTGHTTTAERVGSAWCRRADGQWGMVAGKSWRDPNWDGLPLRDDHPVVCISWDDAQAFCNWLNLCHADTRPPGFAYRLPDESEWEYACRGGRADGAPFWWGTPFGDGRDRLNGASQDPVGNEGHLWALRAAWSDGHAWAAPVGANGTRGQNAYGLSDMLGNVWEWCANAYDAPPDRALRGGSFFCPPGTLRCANRAGNAPDGASANLGFRPCLAPASIPR